MSTHDIAPLQDTIAGEHAAIWVLGVIGGQLPEATQPQLKDDVRAAYTAHRARRDQLVARITDLGGTAVAAATGYSLGDVSTPLLATDAALAVEERCTALYADQVARTTGADRTWAVNALIETAVRQLRFRGSPETFPGTEPTDL